MNNNNSPVVSLYLSHKDLTQPVGTGFFVSPRTILTCSHVASGKKSLVAQVRYPDSPYFKTIFIQAKKMFSNGRLDYAILETSEPFHFLDSTFAVPLDEPIQIICPHEKDSPFTGTLAYTKCISENYLEEISYLVEGPLLRPGTSGSPVLHDGKVLGMHYCVGVAKRNKRKSQCVPMTFIMRDLSKRMGI